MTIQQFNAFEVGYFVSRNELSIPEHYSKSLLEYKPRHQLPRRWRHILTEPKKS